MVFMSWTAMPLTVRQVSCVFVSSKKSPPAVEIIVGRFALHVADGLAVYDNTIG